MKTKEYLGQYIKAKRYAESCFDRLDEALNISAKSPRLDGMPKVPADGDLADTVAKIERIKQKAEAARQKALDLAEEIQDVIEAVPDMEEQRLLRLRYINGMKWEEVADAMGYSVQHIFRLHGDALISAEGFRKDESK